MKTNFFSIFFFKRNCNCWFYLRLMYFSGMCMGFNSHESHQTKYDTQYILFNIYGVSKVLKPMYTLNFKCFSRKMLGRNTVRRHNTYPPGNDSESFFSFQLTFNLSINFLNLTYLCTLFHLKTLEKKEIKMCFSDEISSDISFLFRSYQNRKKNVAFIHIF